MRCNKVEQLLSLLRARIYRPLVGLRRSLRSDTFGQCLCPFPKTRLPSGLLASEALRSIQRRTSTGSCINRLCAIGFRKAPHVNQASQHRRSIHQASQRSSTEPPISIWVLVARFPRSTPSAQPPLERAALHVAEMLTWCDWKASCVGYIFQKREFRLADFNWGWQQVMPGDPRLFFTGCVFLHKRIGYRRGKQSQQPACWTRCNQIWKAVALRITLRESPC